MSDPETTVPVDEPVPGEGEATELEPTGEDDEGTEGTAEGEETEEV